LKSNAFYSINAFGVHSKRRPNNMPKTNERIENVVNISESLYFIIGHTDSGGQEKYLRELSITPVGYFIGAIKNHSCAVSHRNYLVFCMAKMRYFRGTGIIFPRLALLQM
jgi:hypothetical protein